jgi:hypothetical protein
MDYQSLTDFEINQQVATALGLPLYSDDAVEYEQIGDTLAYYDKDRNITTLFNDYCGTPEDAYPIIFENKISTYWNGGVDDDWKARTIHTPFVKDENPLRAAMIIFIMMQNIESDSSHEH